MYDVARRETFTNIGKWLKELDHNVNSDNLVKMLVGNKVDLDRR
jgi:GTPase SAR1 family protein